MPSNLSCYFLDEPLAADELAFVEATLIGPWAKFKTGATLLVQKRVPVVLPLPDRDGHFSDSREHRAMQVCANLRHAQIHADMGKQVVWVMPRDADWDAIFQYAIRIETGVAPYAIQRWFVDGAQVVRRSVRVVDTQRLMQGL